MSTEVATAICSIRAQRKVEQSLVSQGSANEQYIKELEKLLSDNGIPLPERKQIILRAMSDKKFTYVLEQGSFDELVKLFENFKDLTRRFNITVSFRNLGVWTMMAKGGIATVGSTLMKLLCGPGKLRRVDILKGISGRILPGKFTLVLGPPGAGKQTSIKIIFKSPVRINIRIPYDRKINFFKGACRKFTF